MVDEEKKSDENQISKIGLKLNLKARFKVFFSYFVLFAVNAIYVIPEVVG